MSPDIQRAVLGVPGMNYSLLLPRTVDCETYEAVFVPAYPDETDRRFILSFLQMLWDRGEGGGYVHLTSTVRDEARSSCTSPSATGRSASWLRSPKPARWACRSIARSPPTDAAARPTPAGASTR